MLGNPTGFAIGHFRFTQRVQKRGLAVVNVTHHCHHRGTRGFIAIIIISRDNRILDIAFRYAAHFMAQILGDNLRRIGINHIINLRHHALLHQHFNHIDGALGHAIGQFLNGNRIGQLHGAGDFFTTVTGGGLTFFALTATAHRGQRTHALFIIQRIINGQLTGATATLSGGSAFFGCGAFFLFGAAFFFISRTTNSRLNRAVGLRRGFNGRLGFGFARLFFRQTRFFGFHLHPLFSAARIFLSAVLRINLCLLGFFNGARFGLGYGGQTLFLFGFGKPIGHLRLRRCRFGRRGALIFRYLAGSVGPFLARFDNALAAFFNQHGFRTAMREALAHLSAFDSALQ